MGAESGWAVLAPATHIFPSAPTALVKNMMKMGRDATPQQEHQATLEPTNRHHPCGASDVRSGPSGPGLLTVGVRLVGKETWLWPRPSEAKQATGGVCSAGLVFNGEEVIKRAHTCLNRLGPRKKCWARGTGRGKGSGRVSEPGRPGLDREPVPSPWCDCGLLALSPL